MTATGWVQLHQDAAGKWAFRSYEMPLEEETCENTTCLFNLRQDPFERNNVAAAHPDIVARLMARIDEYNRTLVPNQNQPFDLASCPENFPTHMWTPWLNSTPPLPGPHPPGPLPGTSLRLDE